ncbi:hypothetical protein NQZ68_022044 [Dissostichus eleginoides]|nr:hypothetical protein NQZ68_022044 [Dissostichus eleginoides]
MGGAAVEDGMKVNQTRGFKPKRTEALVGRWECFIYAKLSRDLEKESESVSVDQTWWTTTQEVRKERGSPRRMKNLSGGQKLLRDHRGIQDHVVGSWDRLRYCRTKPRPLGLSRGTGGFHTSAGETGVTGSSVHQNRDKYLSTDSQSETQLVTADKKRDNTRDGQGTERWNKDRKKCGNETERSQTEKQQDREKRKH